MENKPSWSLSEDKTTAYVDFPTTPPCRFELQAEELDDLIDSLATMRRQMTPEVPMEANPDPGSRMVVANSGRWYINQAPDGNKMYLALLHPGYRWVAVHFDHQSMRDLRDWLDQNLPHPQ